MQGNDSSTPAGEITPEPIRYWRESNHGFDSEGTPVFSSTDATDEVAALRAELEGYKTGNYDLHGENQALRAELSTQKSIAKNAGKGAAKLAAEVERMRPVVEAAEEFRNRYVTTDDEHAAAVMLAVDAYREATDDRDI